MCYDDHARPPIPPGATGSAQGDDIILTASDGNRFAAYLALPSETPSANVLILPDVRGLHQFYKELALRFAEIGIAAIAMDYFGRTAGIGNRDESFEFWPHVQQTHPTTIFADAHAALAEVRGHTSVPLASCAVGFCFGGALSLLCGTQDLGLAGVVSFYAGLSRDLGKGSVLQRADTIRIPVLGIFGGDDPGIPTADIEALDQALDRAAVEHDIFTYEGAPHSFFDRRADQFARESADAWGRVIRFIAARAARG